MHEMYFFCKNRDAEEIYAPLIQKLVADQHPGTTFQEETTSSWTGRGAGCGPGYTFLLCSNQQAAVAAQAMMRVCLALHDLLGDNDEQNLTEGQARAIIQALRG